MQKFFKNTSNLFRVFFVVFIISLFGALWHGSDNISTEIKSSGGTLTEGIVGAPRFINPVLAQSQADHDLTRLLFTPLISITSDGEIYYELVKDIKVSEDKKTYTLTIKDSIYFTNGQRLTADDVLFTINTIQDPLIKSPLYTQWQGVAVEKIDNNSLSITLDQVFNDFVYNLEIGVLPKNLWKDIHPEEFIFSTYNTKPIGIGPYTVKDISFQENGVPKEYHLSRNQDYFKKIYVENIIFNFFDNEDDLIAALLSGDIESAYGLSPKNLEVLPRNTYSIHTSNLPRIFALFIHLKEDTIFTSESMRQAVNLLIDKEALVDQVFSGYAEPIDDPTGSSRTPEEADTTTAHKLIQEEGWQQDITGMYTKKVAGTTQTLSFAIAIPNLQETEKIASLIKDQLAEHGIRVIIESYDQGNLNQNVIRSREYETLLFGYELEKPSDLFAFWHSSQINDPGLNVSLFEDKKVDIELQKLRNGDDADMNAIREGINKEYPAVFLYSPSFIYVTPKKLHSLSGSISETSDRFNRVSEWYIHTRHLWPFFLK